MKSLRSKQWQRVAGLMVVLAALLGAQFWLWPAVREKAVALHSFRTLEEQKVIIDERLEEVRAERGQLGELTPQLSVIFPEESNTTQPVERLEEVAVATGVKLQVNSIEELKPIEVKQGPGLRPLVIAVEVVAPVQRLFELIDRVEHVPEATRILQYTIEEVRRPEGEAAPSGEPRLHRLTLRVMFYLQEGE